jgi:Protein of unknown function (DUF1292).
MESEMIRIIDVDGVELDVELISILEDKDENNKYLVYTKGETQKSGNRIIYITKLVVGKKGYELSNIADDEEWINVKKIMSEIVSK